MQVDINEVRRLQAQLAAINALDFNSIIWMDGDQEIEVSEEIKENWRFIGMSNCAFVESEYWQPENQWDVINRP